MKNKELTGSSKYLNITMEKSHGIVYTSEWVINFILDSVGYINNLENQTIIDPSCGDGNFMAVILDRLLRYLERENFSLDDKKKIIMRNIYGIDTDRAALEKCVDKLHMMLLKHNIRDRVNFNLYNRNALDVEMNRNLFNNFDFVVGNPPYIRIQNIDKQTRTYIQNNYPLSASGSTDIYLAFFQMGENLLNKTGILGFITPNTFFYSNAARLFRKHLKEDRAIIKIIDFNEKQLFEGITTYSAITIIGKNRNNTYFSYFSYDNELRFVDDIPFAILNDNRWVLDKVSILQRIGEIENHGEKLGKIAEIHVGIATLADDFYIFKDVMFDENKAVIRLKNNKKYEIEREILKPIVKVSTLKNPDDSQNRFVIFPYKLIHDKYTPIEERELQTRYPRTYSYFLSIKERLELRDRGEKISPWYAFGRTQSLNTSFGKKILVSPIGNSPRFMVWNKPDFTFYAGYCIKFNGNREALAQQLNSEDMKFYIEHTSRLYRGGYRSYSKSFIENFGINVSMLN